MKTSYKYLAIALATLLCSCNKELAPDTIESQVQISAQIIPTVVTRVTDDGTAFTNGDAIKVQNMNRENKNLATYIYTAATGKWSTADELYWDGVGANTFNAWYPATSSYGSFTIPADQTTGTAGADWMTASASAKKDDGIVQLSFNHNLAKVTVVIDSWSNEYAANEKVVNSLELRSLSGVISYNGTLSGDNTAKWIKTYTSQTNTSFVAIVAPTTYNADTDIMQIYVNGSSTPLAVKTTSSLTLESGKAYNFKLSVGKDLAAITSSVTIGAWDDETLDDQSIMVELIDPVPYVDELGILQGYGVEIDGVVWAPVNCGYHETDYPYGKIYQWGRKYGQGYSGDKTSIENIVEAPVDLATGQAEENKYVFYKLPNSLYDWLITGDDKLWNAGTEENPIKTIYDPCPEGWRVPTKTELEVLQSNISSWLRRDGQSGLCLSGTKPWSTIVPQVFLPAAGKNYDYTGESKERGSSGYYWSSTPIYGNTSYNLIVYYTGTSFSNVNRGMGYSVRCVKE